MGEPAPRSELGRWTAEDQAAISAAFDAGDLPTEVTLSDGRTVVVCLDEVASLTDTDALDRMLSDLARTSRKNDLPLDDALDRRGGPDGEPLECTTAEVTHRHRTGRRRATGSDVLLGPIGWSGATACGLPDAMDRAELDLWYAEWNVTPEHRRRIADLPDCPRCFPTATP